MDADVTRRLAIESLERVERLTAAGVIAEPERAGRTLLSGTSRPRSRVSVADIVSELRR
jgi:hypothetical protein